MNSSDMEPAAGVLLIAPPPLIDPNFRRTVVLLCEHNDEGSFGLILNRPLTLQLREVLEGMERYKDVLLLGGPVQPNTLHFLHRHGDRVPNAIQVLDDVYWGGDFDIIQELVEAGEVNGEDLRFYLGYAGWSSEQLIAEIEAGGWIVAPADSSYIFRPEPGRLWRDILRSMGGEYAILANFPEDPRMN